MACPEFVLDIFSLEKYRMEEETEDEYDNSWFIKEALGVAVREELTQKQRKYFLAYYSQNLTMYEIAEKYEVNKSTVSREIKNARKRLFSVMRYTCPRLLHSQMPSSNILRKP